MTDLFNVQVKAHFLNFFGIQKLFRVISFFDKKYSKKLFRFVSFVSFFNQTICSRKNFFFVLVNSFLLQLLILLRVLGYLFDFFFVPRVLFCKSLLFGSKINFDRLLVLVYLTSVTQTINIQKMKIFSTPSRQIYVSFGTIKKLCSGSKLGQKMFVLTTNCGLLTHTDVLKKKIGGTLLLVI